MGDEAKRERPARRRWLEVALDTLAVAGIIVVLAFPAAAVISVSHPSAPRLADPAVVLPPLRRSPAGGTLRDVPVFRAGATAEQAVSDGRVLSDPAALSRAIEQQSQATFGGIGSGAITTIADAHAVDDATQYQPALPSAPASWPPKLPTVGAALDSLLARGPLPRTRVDAVNDLAGLLVLAAATAPSAHGDWPAIAADLYDRARTSGDCDPQLNLAFLLSTDTQTLQTGNGTLYDDTVREFDRAAHACPGDPTPRWLLGQFQSGQRRAASAIATFRELEHRFPGSPLGWSGEADALVRGAYRFDVPAPFRSRADFRRARALYQRAELLDPGSAGLASGAARASAGLGAFTTAATQQRRATKRAVAADRAPFQDRLEGYLERADQFGAAARLLAVAPAAAPTLPPGPGLVGLGTDLSAPGVADELAAEDALGPVSIGVGSLIPTRFDIVHQPSLPFTDAVSDISFIPLFREQFGLTNNSGPCRHSRDLLLAGRTTAALADIPTPCTTPESGGVYDAVARFEAGDRDGAVAGVDPRFNPFPALDQNPALAVVLDADQNLWRYAGNLERAALVASQWSRLEAADFRGPDRAGEIAYLRRRYRTAAGYFAEAAKRMGDAGGAGGQVGESVAHEELKQGTALAMAGDLRRARRWLSEADAAASRYVPANSPSPGVAPVNQAVLDSYYARIQAGDTELRAHHFADAAAHYAAARSREAQLPAPDATTSSGGSRREQLYRPEVLENNQALVLVELGHRKRALEAIDAAVRIDPENPVFLANQGFVHEKLGQSKAAEAAYRAALAADPTSFQAANNLGVILADDGHLSLAADAFRQARAANPEYATAAFNLGLVLDRMGPSHLLESQGQLAAATLQVPELREHDHTLISDDESYFATLDLSKPLPPHWHLASSQQRTSITVAGVVLALLLLRLIMTFTQDRALETSASRTVRTTTRLPSHAATFGDRIPGALALVAVVAVFMYPLARSSRSTTGDYLLLGVGVTVTTLAFMRLRSAIARRHAVRAQHYPCLPAVVFGGVAALVGLGFAPMPATKSDDPLPHRARWIATGMLGALTVVLIVVGKVSGVPIATQLGMVCLVMTASALLPVAPYDGEFFEKRHVGLLVAIALAALATLVELGVL